MSFHQDTFHQDTFHQDDFKTMTMIKDGITYKRNKDGDWEEKVTKTISRIWPCCIYMDCDFFSTKKKQAEYKKEVEEHRRKVHGKKTTFEIK